MWHLNWVVQRKSNILSYKFIMQILINSKVNQSCRTIDFYVLDRLAGETDRSGLILTTTNIP